jgi:DNA-binding NarL/FixJ family response regulator
MSSIVILHQRKEVQEALGRMVHRLPNVSHVEQWHALSDFPGHGEVPDLVLMEAIFHPLLHNLPESWNKTRWVVLAQNEAEAAEALFSGANACMLVYQHPEELLPLLQKTLDQPGTDNLARIVKQLRLKSSGNEVLDGNDYDLTAKEKEILLLMRQGVHLKGIAQQTGNTYETIRTHVKRIYKKLEVASASEAVLKAMRMKLG